MKFKTLPLALVGLAAFAVASVIVAISFRLASVEGSKCVAGEGGLPNFQATDPVKPMPSDTFVEDGATKRTLADYRGSGVVLNFWATWCAPCVREMPALDRLRAKLTGDGIQVLTLSVDREGAKIIRKFYAVHRIENLPVLADKRARLLRTLGVRGLPTTVLIDARGNEVGRVVGAAEWDAPEAVSFLRDCLGSA